MLVLAVDNSLNLYRTAPIRTWGQLTWISCEITISFVEGLSSVACCACFVCLLMCCEAQVFLFLTWAGGWRARLDVQEQDRFGQDLGLRDPDHRGARPSGKHEHGTVLCIMEMQGTWKLEVLVGKYGNTEMFRVCNSSVGLPCL